MTPRIAGILGGMGPEATILLQQRILATVQASDDADHIPLLIDMNPQVPSRIAHLIEGTGENPAPILAAMARRLEAAGATVLAMPCNTAHHYAAEIAANVSIPLLNMIELSVSEAARQLPPGASVGILASPGMQLTGVFDESLKRAGLNPLWPDDGDRMLTAVRMIKANGPTSNSRHILLAAVDDLTAKGATLLFIACSEFSLIADALHDTIPTIDTLDVLAKAVHAHVFMK